MVESPYAGLMPFTEEQAPFFFGRDAEREIIIANLLAAKLTLLYGPSGVGKSSVLNAGVVYQLRRAEDDPEATAAVADSVVVPFRNWRDEPLASLEASVRHATGVSGAGATLADRLDAAAAACGRDILIILDQFEEYFMYHPGERGDGTFAGEFVRAVNRPGGHASFLLSMREDSIARLDFFKGRIPHLFDNRLRIQRLEREQARAAITGPIEKLNQLSNGAGGGRFAIEPELVEEVLDQVKATELGQDEAGLGRLPGHRDARIETPHLQLVMSRLWEAEQQAGSRTLRLQTLRQLGNAAEIVRKHVDTALDTLTVDERDAAARIFQYLVTPAGTKIALGVEDLSPNAGTGPDELKQLLVKLSSGERRILTPVAPAPDQPSRERYQIFHDVLAEKVLAWRNRYVGAAEQRAAEALAAEARQRAAKEARAATRLRYLLALVILLFVVVTATVWYAWRQTRQVAQAVLAIQEANSREQAATLSRLAADADREALQELNAALQTQLQAQKTSGQEAERLRQQADQQLARGKAAQDRASQLRAEAAKATQAADAAKGQISTEPPAKAPNVDPPPPALPVPVPAPPVEPPSPAPVPSPVPAPVASPPPETPTVPAPQPAPPRPAGNYRVSFQQAMGSFDRRRWDEAAQRLTLSAAQSGRETGELILITGAANARPYFPKYYLGLALKNQGDCVGALKAWQESEADGAIQKSAQYKDLEQQRQQCSSK